MSLSRESLLNRLSWDAIDPLTLKHLIDIAKNEDLNGYGLKSSLSEIGDCTTQAVGITSKAQAKIVARSEMILCGIHLIPHIIQSFDSSTHFTLQTKDGSLLKPNNTIATLEGNASSILQFERLLLNFLQHLSGIATNTHRYLTALGKTPTALLDTRKTTPGYRYLEKYAVACGGAYNHRLGLFDRILIKDNHLAAANATQGSALTEFLKRIRQQFPQHVIEVEVDQLEQIEFTLAANIDIILLDNFKPDAIRQAVQHINRKAFTEASGGINIENIHQYANLGLDFISTGALVHHSYWADIALDW